MVRRMFELVMAAQVHHLDAVGIQALVVDQPFGKHQRLRWTGRLDVNLALQAFEAMAIGVAQILVEGDALIVQLALRSFRWSCGAVYAQASMSARCLRLRSTI